MSILLRVTSYVITKPFLRVVSYIFTILKFLTTSTWAFCDWKPDRGRTIPLYAL